MHKHKLRKGVGVFNKTRVSIRPYKKLENHRNVLNFLNLYLHIHYLSALH